MDPSAGSDDTLHADLEAAFDAVETGGAPIESGSAPEAPSEQRQSAEPAAKSGGSAETTKAAPAAAATDDRPRDATGKFLPKDTAAAPAAPKVDTKAAAPVAGAKPIPSTDATKASTEQPSTAADAPPVGWTAEGKAEWASLSPAVKAAVLKREVEISSGGRQWSEEKRRYEEIVAPVRAASSRRGITEAEGIQRLMAAQERLDANPAEAIQWLANAYRVPITVNGASPLNGQPAADVSSRIETPRSDPRVDQLWSRVQEQERRETEMTVQKVTSFATDPAHPYFDALEKEIMALLPVLKSSNPTAPPETLLQDAYDRAAWANPETRRAIQAEQAAAEAATRRTTNAADVAKSRLAASSLRPGAPAGVPAAPARDSIREEILAAMGS